MCVGLKNISESFIVRYIKPGCNLLMTSSYSTPLYEEDDSRFGKLIASIVKILPDFRYKGDDWFINFFLYS